ncbi:MAG: hypothetical protein NWE83_07300 [Candidatus Bathyarchaeota archaeon]|nr:hypothetical protein [Candidatus Bathyarchaeota archaeon]
MVRLTTKLKQLKAEKEDTVQTLDKIDNSLLQGSIQEATFKALKQKYDSRLIQLEQEMFETEAEIEARKQARAKKRAKREREEKVKPAESPKPIVTLDKLRFQREYIQKTVDVLEDNGSTDLESVILELLTEKSQMSKKLTAREIVNELRMNTQDHVDKDDVIECLLELYNEGKIKRIEDPKKDLRYYMDVSWNVDSLLTIQR